ncbi:hypothetical protein [Rhodanobacter sp. MP1X3]|uniref:hypothetical protein n=1 Tax=Rhodanobacter sp. MP1X3 TaxID=2723086 RepID=UPI00160DF89F|nr:hypothetical protein [Rhodanobacter sp. MP1X3]MBB6244111.1 hypothetical protein [Rhodanobacter sp. MP1X3]
MVPSILWAARDACIGSAQEKITETQQLKLLAGQVRGLLQQQSNHTIGDSHALDLIVALPGVRNWPEVQAFPERVGTREPDMGLWCRLWQNR